jgi:hypothetical protein
VKVLLHTIAGFGWLIAIGLGIACICAAILNEFYPGGVMQAVKDAIVERERKEQDAEDAREDEIRREEFFDR